MIRHVHRKSARSPEETARIREMRERYQRDKPTPKQLLAEGGHSNFVPLGDLIALHQLLNSLKVERRGKRMTLAKLSELTGIDQAALSRLETGKAKNPTFDTVFRIAFALGKVVLCSIQDAPAESNGKKRRAASQ